ncbi:MAG: hypothetical protein KJ065_21435 [Anaerolineae bacterium]|nr:hypothetical protein [Anaerolineae bacterium]
MSDPELPVFTDHEGRSIRISDERRQHILEHPEMIGQLGRIREVLLTPQTIIVTNSDPSVHVYHRLYEQTPVTRKYLLVAVKILEDDAFILTAFYSSRMKKGAILWQA